MNRPNRLPASLHAPPDEESAVRTRPASPREGKRGSQFIQELDRLLAEAEGLLAELPVGTPGVNLLKLAVLRRDAALLSRMLAEFGRPPHT